MSAVGETTSFAGAAIGAAYSIALMRLLAAMCITGLVACLPQKKDYSAPPDGGAPDGTETNAPPDDLCFGTGSMHFCLAEAPTMSREISGLIGIDTDNPQMCAILTQGNFCVVAATKLSIQATLRATGSRPLALLAHESITIGPTGFVDVGSHSDPMARLGAGHDPLLCDPPAIAPMTTNFVGGGGAGGSFATLGASGGSGADAGGHGGSGGVPAQVATVSGLRGGCVGQAGGGDSGGAGGQGGGAVWLIAGTKIELVGGVNAGGEGGRGGDLTSGGLTTRGVTTGGLATAAVTTVASGGGGGGAGGMIRFDAPTITVSGNPLIHADGGGGGEASSYEIANGERAGNPGSDSYLLFEAAPGGSGNSAFGGDGGAGTFGGLGQGGAKAGVTAYGASGPAEGGGGGGGGGGAGVIIVTGNQYLGTRVSPPAIAPPP